MHSLRRPIVRRILNLLGGSLLQSFMWGQLDRLDGLFQNLKHWRMLDGRLFHSFLRRQLLLLLHDCHDFIPDCLGMMVFLLFWTLHFSVRVSHASVCRHQVPLTKVAPVVHAAWACDAGMRVHCRMSAFVCQTALMCEIQNCGDSDTGSCEEGEHNAWNQMLEHCAHHAWSPALQRCLHEEDLRKVALSCHFALHVISACEARARKHVGDGEWAETTASAEENGRGRWLMWRKGKVDREL